MFDDDLTAESFGCPSLPISKAETYRSLAQHCRHLAGGCASDLREGLCRRADEFEAIAAASI
jgi:hypothetical protein